MAVDYSMRISRLTVDKLGVKLYNRVSAVIAELIANAYDADATEVTVRAPMGQFLASRAGGVVSDKGLEIEVIDNGIGMTPQQVQDFYLVVGAERRSDPARGGKSLKFGRKVMGRKGVGMLAPFGICKSIEVISSGGDLVTSADADPCPKGYLTSHITLDYEGIVELGDEPDDRYKPDAGILDESHSPGAGTRIILRNFNFRKVPCIDVLNRQIAHRFGIRSTSWRIQLEDNTISDPLPETVGGFRIATMPNTRLTFESDGSVSGPDGSLEPKLTAGFTHDDEFYPVTGWMAYSKAPYRDDLMAGVRIYCRGKIAAQTSIFSQRAGFTGEHNVRSYLVGELHSDWLDEDEDLIQTDRRDILWSEELARAFQKWGQGMVRRIGTLSRDPMRQATLELFLEAGNVDARIFSAFPADDQKCIRDIAAEVARSLGRTMSRSEVEDVTVVTDLVELSITLAPHVTLNTMMRDAVLDLDKPLAVLSSFLRTARLAELSSFGRIAEDRLKVVHRLEALKNAEDTNENDLQQLITDAPWLINPAWAPVTENQAFSRLRREFEKYFEEETGQAIQLSDFQDSRRRPDFVLSSQDATVQIIEIKRPRHKLTNAEMDRIVMYHDNMEDFLANPGHAEFRGRFRDFHITVVCDKLGLTGAQRGLFRLYVTTGTLTHMDWAAFLLRTERVHQDFLREAHRQRAITPRKSEDI